METCKKLRLVHKHFPEQLQVNKVSHVGITEPGNSSGGSSNSGVGAPAANPSADQPPAGSPLTQSDHDLDGVDQQLHSGPRDQISRKSSFLF